MPSINVEISEKAKEALARRQAELTIKRGKKVTQDETIEELVLRGSITQ